MPPLISDNLHWWIAGTIIVLGLFVYGFKDVARFSLTRSWAISSVAFSESIRRRVLWIAPLAILGVIVVSQLQKPSDEQDAIRQTIKFSLFATGMVMTITAVILACTNLPREIESRVIYTIVTKPTTRLEIVIGKIIGFAKVSLATLLIMGVFAFGYLHLRAHNLRRDIGERLASGSMDTMSDTMSRSTNQYFAANGLLTSRTLRDGQNLQIVAREPAGGETRRWFFGSGEGDIIVPFALTEADLPSGTPVYVRINLGFTSTPYGQPKAAAAANSLPVGVAAPASQPTTDASGAVVLQEAAVSIQILDDTLHTLIDGRQLNNNAPLTLKDPSGAAAVVLPIAPEVAQNLLRVPYFYVNLTGITAGAVYNVNTEPDPTGKTAAVALLLPGVTPQSPPRGFSPISVRGADAAPIVEARRNAYNQQQLRGGTAADVPVAVYHFHDAAPFTSTGQVGFELRSAIQQSDIEGSDENEPTRAEITFTNRITGQRSQPVVIYPENSRTAYFNVPADALAGGDFDAIIRNQSLGHFVGLSNNSLAMVAATEPFDLNLAKSLGILWLLSLLVVIISVFCSTFVSWPIAIVLTLLLLLGHWGVEQLGDTLAPGIGNAVVTDLFGSQTKASQAKAVSASVEALAKMLNALGTVLPDIDQFSAIDSIEKGISITRQQLAGPLQVLGGFGLPLLVLSYIFLRNKEVAP